MESVGVNQPAKVFDLPVAKSDPLIRHAEARDGFRLIEMGRAFFEEAGYEGAADFLTFDAKSFADTLTVLAKAKLLLVAEKDGEVIGMAAADVATAFWNRRVKLGREAFWWVEPAHRKGIGRKMLTELENAAKIHGARIFDVVAEDGKRSEALARLYRAASYSPAERTFRKVL